MPLDIVFPMPLYKSLNVIFFDDCGVVCLSYGAAVQDEVVSELPPHDNSPSTWAVTLAVPGLSWPSRSANVSGLSLTMA